MTRVPRYMAVPHEPTLGPIDRPSIALNVVGGKTRSGAMPDGGSVFVEQQRRVHSMPSDCSSTRRTRRSSTVGQGAAGGDHLEHLVLRGAKRLIPSAVR